MLTAFMISLSFLHWGRRSSQPFWVPALLRPPYMTVMFHCSSASGQENEALEPKIALNFHAQAAK